MSKEIYAEGINLINAMKTHKVLIKNMDLYVVITIEITPEEAARLARVYGRSLHAEVSHDLTHCQITFKSSEED